MDAVPACRSVGGGLSCSARIDAAAPRAATDETDRTPESAPYVRVLSVSSVNLHGGEGGSSDVAAALDYPLRAWCLCNADLLSEIDRRLGHDPGGFCAAHGRWLSCPEQRRGACSWCVPVERGPAPEYWASCWRRFAARRP